MDIKLRDQFIDLWKKYFNNTELPITFYYTDNDNTDAGLVIAPTSAHQCMIGTLNKVRKGTSLCFEEDSFGCFGAKRYLGYAQGESAPNFEYFLSCGIPGKMEGERYKKSPVIVKELMNNSPEFEAPAKYIVFKKWDMLTEYDKPAVVIFWVPPDVLSGLFTLVGFEESDREAVIAPFAAGCGSIVMYPYLEKEKDQPRSVLGMFDVSARPFVPKETLSFAVPMNKFERMIHDMEESFLITQSWLKVQKRI